MPESSHSLSLAEATAQMTAPGQLFEMENVELMRLIAPDWFGSIAMVNTPS